MTRPDRHQSVDVEGFARRIIDARAASRTLPAPLGHGLSPEDAYRVQALVLDPRMRAGGGRGGWKLGYTSAVMREQMGIAEPNVGPLAQAMILDGSTETGATISTGVTQPKVEPEVAAVLGRDVPSGASIDDLRHCVAEWRLALEIVDSVWEGYRFDWALNTADGSSAAFVVLGPAIWSADQEAGSPVDLASVEVRLERRDITGAVLGESVGRSEAAMGDPVLALHWLSDQLGRQGDRLRAGDVVITGGLTKAEDLAVGDVITGEAVVPGRERRVGVTVRRA